MTSAARTPAHRWRRHPFALSGPATLAASIGAPVLLPYPPPVSSLRRGWRLPAGIPDGRRLLIATLAACLVLEPGAWAHNFIRDAAEPALFHPQLLPDLLMAAGFHAGWWLAWWWLLRRWRMSGPMGRPRTTLLGRWKYPAALAAMCAGSVGLMILWNLPLSWLDAIPPERLPMRSHPFR